MGSLGANKNTAIAKGADYFVDKSVTELFEVAQTHLSLRDTFDLQSATDNQLTTLSRVISGINRYDRGYDDNKTPYNIVRITVSELKPAIERTQEEIERDRRLGIRHRNANPIYINIDTVPNVDSAIIRMMDEKSHNAIIGVNGGLYTYTDKGKKKSLDLFNVQYGKRAGI